MSLWGVVEVIEAFKVRVFQQLFGSASTNLRRIGYLEKCRAAATRRPLVYREAVSRRRPRTSMLLDMTVLATSFGASVPVSPKAPGVEGVSTISSQFCFSRFSVDSAPET